MLMLGVIHLWRPQKVTNFVTPHPQKWTIDLLFKNNRIRRHVTNFKTPSVWTSWRYVLLFWSPCFAKTPCCSYIVKTSKCVLESRVIMIKGKYAMQVLELLIFLSVAYYTLWKIQSSELATGSITIFSDLRQIFASNIKRIN